MKQLKELLLAGGEGYYAKKINQALRKSEEDMWMLLCSNDLWGGAGSIADQAALEKKDLRYLLESILIEVGELQIECGRTNVRTEMWVNAFKRWKQEGICT